MYRQTRDTTFNLRPFGVVSALMILSGMTGIAAGQEGIKAELVPAEAFVEDSSVLSTSLRNVEYGLQIPYGFEQLMREDIPGGNFVCQAGGLWAVFPTTTYIPVEHGYAATWGPNTCFYIGPPPGLDAPPPQPPSGIDVRMEIPREDSTLPVDTIESKPLDGRTTSVDKQAGQPLPLQVRTEPPPIRTELVRVQFLVDDKYREQRMASLVQRSKQTGSAQAARGPSSSESK